MPRKFIKKLMPHPRHITENKWIRKLGPRLQDPSIWHINRRSVSGGTALGLFCAFIPMPFQMLIAAIGAILFRVNILVSVPMVWVSNPITMPPMFYFCYRVGLWILNSKYHEFKFELSFHWLANELLFIWQPFLLGCFIVGVISSALGFTVVRLLWRYQIAKHLKYRKTRHQG